LVDPIFSEYLIFNHFYVAMRPIATLCCLDDWVGEGNWKTNSTVISKTRWAEKRIRRFSQFVSKSRYVDLL